MENIKKTINFYGDTLVYIESAESFVLFLDSITTNNVPYIIHFHGERKKLSHKNLEFFTFIAERDGINVFANDGVLNKCPKLINEKVSGTTVVLQVYVDNSESGESGESGNKSIKYNVFVKDRTKKYITNPAGTMEYNENFIQCGIRECKEETGLSVVLTEKDLIGSFGYMYTLFEMKWPGDANIYKCLKKITQTEFEALEKFECGEIEKIHLIPSDSLVKDMSIDGFPISSHHLLAARYVYEPQLDWESEKPTYLKDFKLI